MRLLKSWKEMRKMRTANPKTPRMMPRKMAESRLLTRNSSRLTRIQKNMPVITWMTVQGIRVLHDLLWWAFRWIKAERIDGERREKQGASFLRRFKNQDGSCSDPSSRGPWDMIRWSHEKYTGYMLVWQKFLLVVPKLLLTPGHKQMSVYLSLMVISLIRIDGFYENTFSR